MHETLRLPAARTALLLIDLQEEHRMDPRYLVAGYDAVLHNAARLLDAARGAGVRVLHAAYLRDFAKVPPRPFEPVEVDGTPAFSAPGTALTDICPEVAPLEGEAVSLKNDLSCFSDDGFEAMIADRPDWLVVCGVWSEACVAATIRDAVARGIRVLMVKDACGSGTDTMHQVAILNLANRLYGGAVCDTRAATALLRGEEATAWRLQGAAPLRFDADSIAQEFARL